MKKRESFYQIMLDEGMTIPMIDDAWDYLEWSENVHLLKNDKELRKTAKYLIRQKTDECRKRII